MIVQYVIAELFLFFSIASVSTYRDAAKCHCFGHERHVPQLLTIPMHVYFSRYVVSRGFHNLPNAGQTAVDCVSHCQCESFYFCM